MSCLTHPTRMSRASKSAMATGSLSFGTCIYDTRPRVRKCKSMIVTNERKRTGHQMRTPLHVDIYHV